MLGGNYIAAAAAALAMLAVAMTVASSTAAAGDGGVIETDEAGALQINSSDPLTQPVLLNGQDVLSVIEAQTRVIEEQESIHKELESSLSELQQLSAEGRREIAALRREVCRLDVHDSTIDWILGAGSDEYKWGGGVLAPNGLIYGVPNHATTVLIIDPNTETADTTSLQDAGAGSDKYHGGVLAPNGLIFAIPYSADSVLVIDAGC